MALHKTVSQPAYMVPTTVWLQLCLHIALAPVCVDSLNTLIGVTVKAGGPAKQQIQMPHEAVTGMNSMTGQLYQANHGMTQSATRNTQENASATDDFMISVPLWKQYVPVIKASKIVAYKTAYYGKIMVGSLHLEEFTVVFDTGSGHVILPSTACNTETCMKHTRYNRSKSMTAVDIEMDGSLLRPGSKERDQVSIAFGTGEVLGEFVGETVCIGGSSTCASTRIIAATDMTPDPFGLFAFDGVLGLGLSALTLSPLFNFFAQLAAQHPTMESRFGVFLARSESDGASLIAFGGYDKERTASHVRWTPVAMPEMGYWQVRLKGVRLGNTTLKECEDGSCRAILDTGTSLLGVPQFLARQIHRNLARPVPQALEQAPSRIDCRQVEGPMVNFDLDDELTVSLQSEDYSRPVPFNMTMSSTGKAKLFCRSLLLPVDMAPPLGPKVFIWGEPVLRRYYTVYDFGQKQIGFSLARHSYDSLGGQSSLPSGPNLVSGAPLASQSISAHGVE